jgi:hypothetical protein
MRREGDHQRLVAAGQETPRKDVEPIERRLQGIPKVSRPPVIWQQRRCEASKYFDDDVRTTTPRLLHCLPLAVSFLNRGFRVGTPVAH